MGLCMKSFFAARLVGLRMEKGVSQQEMSEALGKHPGYILRIERRQMLPPMEVFFAICSYLETTPHEFFSDSLRKPDLLQRAIDGLEKLKEEDLMLAFLCIRRLQDC